jgi:hypothetical protein
MLSETKTHLLSLLANEQTNLETLPINSYHKKVLSEHYKFMEKELKELEYEEKTPEVKSNRILPKPPLPLPPNKEITTLQDFWVFQFKKKGAFIRGKQPAFPTIYRDICVCLDKSVDGLLTKELTVALYDYIPQLKSIDSYNLAPMIQNNLTQLLNYGFVVREIRGKKKYLYKINRENK